MKVRNKVAKPAPAQYKKEDQLFIKNHKITNRESFLETIKEPRQIAGLYFYQMLDSLVDLAYRVSVDFRKRPQFYRDLGQPSIAETLAKLNAQYGTEVSILSGRQRNEIYLPIFGNSENESFPRLRNDLIRAARAFAERSASSGIEMLRDGVRTAHRPFKDYLLGLQGDSVRFSGSALLEQTEKTCYPVLRSQAVAAVFGIAKHAAVEYPYATDSGQDLLIEAVSVQLTVSNAATYMTREGISNIQRAALRGAEAIATAIDFEEAEPGQTDEDLDLLISKCYTWGTALASVKPQPTVSTNQGVQPNGGASATTQTSPTSSALVRSETRRMALPYP